MRPTEKGNRKGVERWIKKKKKKKLNKNKEKGLKKKPSTDIKRGER